MATNGYGLTIATATSAGSTAIGVDVEILKVTNTDATNFVTLSWNGAIDGSGEEFVLLAGESISYELSGGGVRTETLYHQADTAAVNISVVGKRS